MVDDLQNLSFELHEPQDRKNFMIPGNMIPKFPIPNIHYENNGVYIIVMSKYRLT